MSSLFIPPALLLTFILALFYGSLLHLFQGGSWRQFGSILLIALLGFGLGQLLGMMSQWPLPTLGQTRLIEGTVFCWLLLWVARKRKLW